MDTKLEIKLREAYPDGYLSHLNVDACDFDYANGLATLLGKSLPSVQQTSHASSWCVNERVVNLTFALTLANGPFGRDVDDAAGSLYQWLTNTGEPELRLVVMVSTLYPVWTDYCYLRTPGWSAAASSDANLAQFSPAPLEIYLATVTAVCASLGLRRLTPAELAEPVPFVTACAWASDTELELLDDPDADFTPAPTQIACTVEDCLFKQD